MLIANVQKNLNSQIAKLTDLEPVLLKTMAREVLLLEEQWTCEYGEYQTGGWKTLSIYNQSRDQGDTIIRDGAGMETNLVSKVPKIRSFLRDLNLDIMSARIALLEPQAFLWEHRDYAELDAKPRLRLHVPLVTNPGCQLIINGHAIHMDAGGLWMLNPTERHGACNLGLQARYHLLIDVYVCKNLEALLEGAALDPRFVTRLPAAKPEELQDTINKAVTMAKLGYGLSAESTLLKIFHRFNLEEGMAYELIIRMYEGLNNDREIITWQQRRDKFLGRSNHATVHA